jgi:hypothetical protein
MSYMNDTIVGTVVLNAEVTEGFVSDILYTALDAYYGGSDYWVTNVKFKTNGADDIMERICQTAYFEDALSEDNKSFVVDPDKVLYSLQKILNEDITLNQTIYGNILRAVKENDASYVGADEADVILQIACFREIVYG